MSAKRPASTSVASLYCHDEALSKKQRPQSWSSYANYYPKKVVDLPPPDSDEAIATPRRGLFILLVCLMAEFVGVASYLAMSLAGGTKGPLPVHAERQVLKPSVASPTCLVENNATLRCKLLGDLIQSENAKNFSLSEIGRLHGADMRPGGYYEPTDCQPTSRIAIIVPFRNRAEHLRGLLQQLVPYLKQQRLAFVIIVVEQVSEPNAPFNRAMLLNIGFVEANRLAKERGLPGWCCFAFHDVDRYPTNGRHSYRCPERGIFLHLSNWQYQTHFGGVGVINGAEFETMNGFSNLYFGYGAEDDEIVMRGKIKGYKVWQDGSAENNDAANSLGHVAHPHDNDNPFELRNYRLAGSVRLRMPTDGLNCLEYDVGKVIEYPTHTVIQAHFNEYNVFQRFFAKCATGHMAHHVSHQFKEKVNLLDMMERYRQTRN